MIKAPWWVWLSVLACLGASLASLAQRNRMESSNTNVGVMVEMADIEAIAAATGVDRSQVMASLKQSGLTGVAITEDTIGDLVKEGRLVLAAGGRSLVIRAVQNESSRWIRPGAEDRRYIGYQYQPDLYHLDRAATALARRGFYDLGTVNVPAGVAYPTSISVDQDADFDVSLIPVGIDPRAAYEATREGLVVVARHFNETGADGEVIVRTLRDSKAAGATAFLIGGDQALGNRDQIEVTAETLRQLDMTYLSPEFVSLGGDAYLRKSLAAQTIRLHSVPQLDTETLGPRQLEERLAKAFRERSVRWLLLRPPTKSSGDILRKMDETLIGIRTAIERAGGKVGPPKPFTDPGVSPWLLGAIAVLAFPAVLWAAFASLGFNWTSYAVGFVAMGLSASAFVGEFREFAALALAVAFPVAGFMAASPNGGDSVKGRNYPLVAVLSMSFFSLVGGLAVGGMLVGVEYTIRVQQFTGVKAAMFLPLLVVGWVLLKRQGPISETFAKPVSWAAATVAIVGLVLIALIALRSGNESPEAVSSVELSVRSMLDNLLHVRPRSKEVAFGHPALVLGLCLLALAPKLRGWAALLLLAGMVGQTSIVNTMCHLHTPALLSVQRIGVGLALGGIIGGLAWVVARRFVPVQETAESNG